MNTVENLKADLSSVQIDLENARLELEEVRVALGIPTSVRLVDGVQRLKEKMRAAKRRARLGLHK